ncbi:MAG: sugar phosphate nucleotidyltransferase [Microscillaceae bacterium]|jgi:NDP-sugar pyrophosphorylase family protein|nr:sugar phosphate nucleotidyltransferase [Microscillaceae bacterium]
MRAIILAGGRGTRLKPYTATIPKPLVPIGGEMPILEIIIKQLANAGFSHITITLNHMADFIKAFFGNGSKWQLQIDYSTEDRPLSTIGPLTLINDLPENFLVMNGDILCDLDYRAFYQHHCQNHNDVSVSVYKRDSKIDFGVLQYNENQLITQFIEKPVYQFDVSMGIYCLNRRVVESLPKNEPYGFDSLMLDGIAEGKQLEAVPFPGFWLDIGRPDDYDYANENFAEIAQKLGIDIRH